MTRIVERPKSRPLLCLKRWQMQEPDVLAIGQTAALPLWRAMAPEARGRLALSSAFSYCLQLRQPNPAHPVMDHGRLAGICEGGSPQGRHLSRLPLPDIVSR